uniref:Uncharacterized protein n=1 Tax=Globodera rostochiensis TaxID=31243 RepID=A0A914IEI1_GLORO
MSKEKYRRRQLTATSLNHSLANFRRDQQQLENVVKFGKPFGREKSTISVRLLLTATSRLLKKCLTVDHRRAAKRRSTIDEQQETTDRREQFNSPTPTRLGRLGDADSPTGQLAVSVGDLTCTPDRRPSTRRKGKRWPKSDERVGKLGQAGDQRRIMQMR